MRKLKKGNFSMKLSRRQFTGLALSTSAAVVVGAAPSFAGSGSRRGSLSGRKGYNVVGTVEVKKSGGKTTVHLADN